MVIAKKQRLERQSAKQLINFENIVVDTDFGGALSFRSEIKDRIDRSRDNEIDEEIELENFGNLKV